MEKLEKELEDLNKLLNEQKKGEISEKIANLFSEIKILESEKKVKTLRIKDVDQVNTFAIFLIF